MLVSCDNTSETLYLFQITVSIDGSVTATGTTTGEFTKLSSNILYVGGSPHTASLPGSQVRANFMGCLREVDRLFQLFDGSFLHFLVLWDCRVQDYLGTELHSAQG